MTLKLEINVSVPFLILLVGFSYVLLVGGLAFIRREGLSTRFAIEAVVVTILVSGFTFFTSTQTNPVLFLIVLYLITMRVRLLIDLASIFARQGSFSQAEKLYTIASRLWPDPAGELILKINQATLFLQENRLDDAIAMLSEVLNKNDQGNLGLKYEAAAHYNLGVAYLRKNMGPSATIEFNAVIDNWPGSLYARHAEAALEKRRLKK